MATKTRNYGRGILRFTSLQPCRRPGQTASANDTLKQEGALLNSRVQNGGEMHVQRNGGVGNVPTPPAQKGGKPVRLLAKYNYKANPAKPGGFDELALTQGEKLVFVRPHPLNPFWWEAKNENGEGGFVPASYMMVLEDKITSLPWLEDAEKEDTGIENEQAKGNPGAKPALRPYVSAYGSSKSDSSQENQYYCEICDKKLNGPIPYEVHLNSKAHKEEVAVREEFNT